MIKAPDMEKKKTDSFFSPSFLLIS